MRRKLRLKLFFHNECGESVDLDLYMLSRAAVNSDTPYSLLRELAKHCDARIRLAVAQNPSLSPDILEQLLSDSRLKVVHQALRHPHITLEDLNGSPEFKNAKNWRLRVMIARNLQTSVDILLQLAEDDSAFVRYAVSRNPNTPQEIAMQAGDPGHFQQLLQAGTDGSNRKQLERLGSSYSVKLRKAVANNPNTPRRVMDALLVDSCYQVRRELARNQKASEHMLGVLANDQYSCVRVSVVANSNTSREIKLKLCQDPDRRVQRVALKYTYSSKFRPS
jgi:hypothetical protein